MAEVDRPFVEWIGRTSEHVDEVTPRLVESYRAIFGDWLAPTSEAEAPHGLHWCLSPAIAPMDALGRDGHPAKNRDLPPVPLPRRMWAGGRIETLAPLRIGDAVRRVSTIADVTCKHGRSGELWFVAVDHDYHSPRGLAIRERHDIVYRADSTRAAAGPVAEREPVWTRRFETSPVLLFRYSAITFNGHRIHYDPVYAKDVEGYSGLVVHGPLQASLPCRPLSRANRSLSARAATAPSGPLMTGARCTWKRAPVNNLMMIYCNQSTGWQKIQK